MKKLLAILGLLGGFTPAAFAQHTVTATFTTVAGAGGYYLYRESAAGSCTPTGVGTCNNTNATASPGTPATCPTTFPAGSTCVSIVDSSPTAGTSFYVVRSVSTSTCAPHSQGTCESNNSPEISVVVPLPQPQPPAALAGKVN